MERDAQLLGQQALARLGCTHQPVSVEQDHDGAAMLVCNLCDKAVIIQHAEKPEVPLHDHIASEEWCHYCNQAQPCRKIRDALQDRL